MLNRIKYGIIIGLIFVPLLFIQSIYLTFTVASILLIFISKEYANTIKINWIYTYFMMSLATYTTIFSYSLLTKELFTIICLISILISIFLVISNIKIRGIWVHYLMFCYIGFGVGCLASFVHFNIIFLLYVVLSIIFTDIFAYFVGTKIGKHKIAPKISPKKSIEGSIGGSLISTIIITPLLFFATKEMLIEKFNFNQITIFFILFLFTVVLTIVGQFGDLLASKIKREYNIKDFSNIIPGHGGILDRFDSLLLGAIFAAILMVQLG